MRTYSEALDVISTARDQSRGKPVGHHNTRLVWTIWEGTVGLGVQMHDTVIVNYLPDGTYVINSGGWRTHFTLAYIQEFGPRFLEIGGCQGNPILLPTGHVLLKPITQAPVDHEELETVNEYTGQIFYGEGGYTRKPVMPWIIGHVHGFTADKWQKCRTCKGLGFIPRGRQEVDRRCHRCNPAPAQLLDQGRLLDGLQAAQYAGMWSSAAGFANYGHKPIRRAFLDNTVVDQYGKFVRYGYTPPFAIGRLPKGLEHAMAKEQK